MIAVLCMLSALSLCSFINPIVVYIHIYIYTYIHTYIYIYIHTYILTYFLTYLLTCMHTSYTYIYIQEFVLNTPTLQSMKWFNSNIGLAATHAVVYAQLMLDGLEKGVHVFMVQIRDEEHRPLPGIEVGDVGEKFGDHTIDTGYLRLKNVRIPRKHMLSKRQHVTSDGR